jgi:Uma2 family endonuclease
MTSLARKQGLTFAEYVALESASDVRHELVDGEMYLMTGGSPAHAFLSAKMSGLLLVALRGSPCRVFSSDLRVAAEQEGFATYPDVTVVCGKLETSPEDRHGVTNPRVLVEVLSPSTEGYDRGGKFARYRRLPTLQEYVVVSQDRPLVEVYRRNADGTWTMTEAGPGGVVQLSSVGATLSMDELYADVPPGDETPEPGPERA